MVAINPNPDAAKHCTSVTLRCLLDDTLDDAAVSTAEAHLASCDECRMSLESIVGDQETWNETREVLSGTMEDQSGFRWLSEQSETKPSSYESANHWLATILSPGPPTTMGRLGRYDILKVIGVGGMGVVVSAIDPQLNRPVAIKLLAPHLAPLGTARRRFAQESRAVAAVVHPSIMPIYDINDDNLVPYLVMPLVTGGSLQSRIDRDGPLSLEDVIGIGLQIADGLEAAHAQGIVHRDIKPGNVLVEENSVRVMITDFGLARALDDASATVSGMIAGTPQYMSPEQAVGSRIDHRSDLFSLGSVMYATATGRPPFRAESPVAVLRRIADFPAKSPSEIRDELPLWFDQLVARFLEKDPEIRIASAAEARDLLHEVQLHLRRPSTNELPPSLTSVKNTVSRKFTSIALVLAVACLTIISIALYMASLPSNKTTTQKTDSKSPVSDEASLRDSQSDAKPITKPEQGATQNLLPQNTQTSVSEDWNWIEFQTSANEISNSLSDLERRLQATHYASQGENDDE